MKVMCICDKWRPSEAAKDRLRPCFGDIDTVINEKYDGGIEWLFLERFGPNDGFWKGMFAPISDIDETDRLEAWQSERAKEDNLLVALAEASEDIAMPQDSFERVWKNISRAL